MPWTTQYNDVSTEDQEQSTAVPLEEAIQIQVSDTSESWLKRCVEAVLPGTEVKLEWRTNHIMIRKFRSGQSKYYLNGLELSFTALRHSIR